METAQNSGGTILKQKWNHIEESIQREMRKSFLRVAHLSERLVLGPLTPSVRTPFRKVFMWDQITLMQYTRRKTPQKPVPVLIIPPLMVQPHIFDLRPGHSLIEYLQTRGLEIFLLDLGVPTKEERGLHLEDYVLDYLPKAVEKTREFSGSEKITLLGWSMGGIFIYLYLSIHLNSTYIKNAVLLGSPADFSEMFPFNWMARIGKRPVKILVKTFGNIPPFLSKNAFRIMRPVGLIVRYWDLLVNLWDREWMAGYETIGQWIGSFIPYPGETFTQFVTDFVASDALKKKQILVGGKTVELDKINSSVLIVSGTTDIVASMGSVEALYQLISSTDKKILRAPVGHIGLIAGSTAPEYVWRPVGDWIVERSEEIYHH